MKKLNDCSHFDADKPPLLLYKGGMYLYYRLKRRSFRVVDLNAGAKYREILHCGSIRHTTLLPGAHYRRVSPVDLSVEYIRSGTLQFRQEGRGYELSAGEIFLLLPGMTGEFLAVRNECEKISILVNGTLLGDYLEKSGLVHTEALSDVAVNRFEHLIWELEALSGQSGIDVERENSFLTWRLLDFLRHCHPVQRIPAKFAECEAAFREHLGDPQFSVEDLARKNSISVNHFIRLFRKYYGETPHRYLVRIRMEKAARLLAVPETPPIKEIAAEAGYRNALNFSTEFRKFYGIPPSQYAEHEKF